ncbi:hydrogenase maturation nickel metallochaperone HypA [bacterium]|nr:hydrogenase maturation nickel metallochaperone HypA [bacterium]
MHELSVAAELVRNIEQYLHDRPGSRVVLVRVRIGVYSGVDEDALRRVYPVASERTCLEDSQLVIETSPPSCSCSECGMGGLTFDAIPCPRCGSFNLRLITGRELEIESVELDEEDDPVSEKKPSV